MCFACSFKLWLTPSQTLTDSINSAALRLKESTAQITEIAAENEKLFKQLRKAKPELSKLSVQVAELREEKPALHDLYQLKRDKVIDLNSSIYSNTLRLLFEIENAMQMLLRISLDSNILIRRKDARLTKFIRNIMALKEEPKLKHELILRLNAAKGDIKSTALKLLQAAKFQEKKILEIATPKKIKMPVAAHIEKLGIDIRALESTLEKLGIENIDEFIDDMEREIQRLKEIQLDALLLMPIFEGHLIRLRKSLYLLEEETAKKLSAKLDATEKNFNARVSTIASSAQKLFENILIIGESR